MKTKIDHYICFNFTQCWKIRANISANMTQRDLSLKGAAPPRAALKARAENPEKA